MPGDADLSPGPSDTTSPPPPQGGGGGGGGVVKQGRKRTLSSSSDFRGALHLQPLTQQPLASRPNERLPSIDSFHTTTHQHPPPPRQLPPPPHNAPTSHPQGPPQPPQHSSLPSSASSEPSTAYRTHSSPNGVGYWKGLSESSDKRASGNFPFDSSERAASIGTSGPETSNLDWDEELVIQCV